MPSHLKEPNTKKFRPPWVTDLDILGNSFADALAGDAAEDARVSLQTAIDCRFYYKFIKAVQWRLIGIHQNLPERQKYKTIRSPTEEVKSLQDKCEESKHKLVREGDRMLCTICLDNFKIKDESFLHWLAGQCVPATSSEGTIRKTVYNKHLHVGNQYVHFTHEVIDYKGFLHCKKCGSKATNLIRNLAKPCSPPGKAGKHVLRCIKSDKLPPGLSQWPA